MADFLSVGKPFSFARPTSLDMRFGPFESIAAAYQTVGPNGLDAIYAGLIFCIVNSNGTQYYKWTKTNNPTVSDVERVVPNFKTINGKVIVGDGNIQLNNAIVITDTKDSGTLIPGTSSNEGSESNIYYYKDLGIFGLSTDGGKTYYKHWTNEDEFGQYTIWDANYSGGIYNGNLQGVTPYNNRIYIVKNTGEIKLGTDKDLDDMGSNPPDLTEAQQDAIDSGITKDKVAALDAIIGAGLTADDIAELKRLKGINIVYTSSTDKLTLSDGSTRKGYDLSGQGGSPSETTYGTPTINVTYPQISVNGGKYSPSVQITQVVYVDSVESTTNTYNSISEFLSAGGSITFGWTDLTDKFESIDSETGEIEADTNESGSQKSKSVTISVSINGKSNSKTITVTQGTTAKLHIVSVEYNTVDSGNGTYTATPTITASDNNTYSVSDYNNQSVESFTFKGGISGTLNSSTGVITYNPTTIISNMAAGSTLGTMLITIEQENSNNNINDIEYNWFNYSNLTTALCAFGIRGSKDGGKIYKPGTQSTGIASVTINATAGDIYVIGTSAATPTYIHIWETSLNLLYENAGVASIANASKWTTNAATNYNTFVSSVGGKETRIYASSSDFKTVYKVVGNVNKLTFSVFGAGEEDVIYYKKINQ